MYKRDKRKCFISVLSMGAFLLIIISLTACTFWAACIFSPANTSFYPYEQKTVMMSQPYVGMELPDVWKKEMLKREEEAAWKRAYLYVMCNMREYLAGQQGDRENPAVYDSMDLSVYLGLYDFDGDGIPELLAGDTTATAVFTFADGQVEKLMDAKNPEEVYICFGVPLPKKAGESIRLVHEASGWILKFPSGEEAVLDSEFNYDFIRW